MGATVVIAISDLITLMQAIPELEASAAALTSMQAAGIDPTTAQLSQMVSAITAADASVQAAQAGGGASPSATATEDLPATETAETPAS